MERQLFRLAALRECHSCMWRAGVSALPFEAAVWLLEEEEEIKGGHVHVGGQASGGGVPSGRRPGWPLSLQGCGARLLARPLQGMGAWCWHSARS